VAHHVRGFRDLGNRIRRRPDLIYILVVGWFESFRTPFTIMATIPSSLIGIIPMHAMVGRSSPRPDDRLHRPGAGIVVRNSDHLVDFVELR